MSQFKTFALVGAGLLGKHLVDAFSKENADLRVLTRSSEKKVPENVQTRVVVDYKDEDSLVKALEGVDVVVSTLGQEGLAIQPEVFRAAAKAGVQLIVPSEFGCDTTDREIVSGTVYYEDKATIHELIKSLHVPYALFFNAAFTDFIFSLYPAEFGFDVANSKVKIYGSGDVPVSFTTTWDVARYVAHVLTTLPKKELENRVFRIEGDTRTGLEIVQIIEKIKAEKVQVEKGDLDLLRDKVSKDRSPAAFVDYINYLFAEGKTKFAQNDNGLYPEWNPMSVQSYIESMQ